MSEWVIKFNSLFKDSRHQRPYSPYKPCNHNLYIGIIIFLQIDNTQNTGHNQLLRKKILKNKHKKWGHWLSWLAIGDSNSTPDYNNSKCLTNSLTEVGHHLRKALNPHPLNRVESSHWTQSLQMSKETVARSLTLQLPWAVAHDFSHNVGSFDVITTHHGIELAEHRMAHVPHNAI